MKAQQTAVRQTPKAADLSVTLADFSVTLADFSVTLADFTVTLADTTARQVLREVGLC